ncbi:hypothetical protein PAPHI01_1302 [Pancytospora philotis]|nr:hypothetical protein PAPHI01_1302 [Pancytospora philotis]
MHPASSAAKPTRTLLITGFDNEAAYDSYRKLKIPRNMVAEEYTVPKTNFLFVIFYDVRDAIDFVKNFSDAPLRVQYTISKHELPRKGDECSEKNLQSSVSFDFKNVTFEIEDTFLNAFLKQYGEIREIRSDRQGQKIVEFYDRRAAKKAFDTLNDSVFGTGAVKCRWMWDLPLDVRCGYLKATDAALKELAGLGSAAPAPEPATKRFKAASSGPASKKNIFVERFDKLIGTNISEIERIIRF